MSWFGQKQHTLTTESAAARKWEWRGGKSQKFRRKVLAPAAGFINNDSPFFSGPVFRLLFIHQFIDYSLLTQRRCWPGWDGNDDTRRKKNSIQYCLTTLQFRASFAPALPLPKKNTSPEPLITSDALFQLSGCRQPERWVVAGDDDVDRGYHGCNIDEVPFNVFLFVREYYVKFSITLTWRKQVPAPAPGRTDGRGM